MNPFVDYTIAFDGKEIPPVTNKLFEYVMAKDGLYIRGKRPGIEVCWPIGATHDDVRGLADLESCIQIDYPRVPGMFLLTMLGLSRTERDIHGQPIEKLFHIQREANNAGSYAGWKIVVPEQLATSTSVRPVRTGAGSSTENAVIELHSHHSMAAFFSGQDDKDEAQGFRIYAVIGDIFDRPTISVRIGMFGHFIPIPAGTIFEMPPAFTDAADRDAGQYHLR